MTTKPSNLWTNITSTQFQNIDDDFVNQFRIPGGPNARLAAWDPYDKSMRYYKFLLYNSARGKNLEFFKAYKKIKNVNVGQPPSVNVGGCNINIDHLFAVEEALFIRGALYSEIKSVVEIGAGFGRTCQALLGIEPAIQIYTIIDLPEIHHRGFTVKDICPFSRYNLVTTNLFTDEAYYLLANSLTQAEQAVLTPLHMQLFVIRKRSNNIAFSSHGGIYYPLKSMKMARNLPWYDFKEVPIMVSVFTDFYGEIHLATIYMKQICHVRELMQRKMNCPVYDTIRNFYILCSDHHVPFSNKSMKLLSDILGNLYKRSYPKDFRVLNTTDVH